MKIFFFTSIWVTVNLNKISMKFENLKKSNLIKISL